MEKVPNALIHSVSPYLLQHAYNPVQWFPWSEAALQKARDENKLVIISIGYSSCHWCHVMEHESFEDEEVATVMNKSFVCIKVDREERPDIDQLYMDAVQLMTGRGGWPLNMITLPDQRPIYGGTYFPKEQWRNVLLQLAAFWRNDPQKCFEYAEELTEGVKRMGRVALVPDDHDRSFPSHSDILDRWSKQWDREEGGSLRAPKFPMPDSLRYLLAAAEVTGRTDAKEHVFLTLDKMAMGGIYDQIGGGFARYSVDMIWKVPHFEKMLYDNAQLISLYCDAWKLSGKKLYQEVVEETMDFILREMTSPSGGFYSALDADSEGVEGKFYCWNPDDLKFLSQDDFHFAVRYFNINENGYWEHDRYIPLRIKSDEEMAEALNIPVTQLRDKVQQLKKQLLEIRDQRIRPGLDHKILCSWNALMLSACLDAYSTFGNEEWKQLAIRNLTFIRNHFLQNDLLKHSAVEKEGKVLVSIDGFLEDYAFFVDALIRFHAVAPALETLSLAKKLSATVIRLFDDPETGFFWFSAAGQDQLIARKQDVQDNVMPSSNAVMSHNLLRLSRLTGDMTNEEKVLKCLRTLREDIVKSTPWYSRWAMVFLMLQQATEIEVAGDNAAIVMKEMLEAYLPFAVFEQCLSAERDSKSRYQPDKTLIYVCRDKACFPPVNTVAEGVRLASDYIK